MKRFHSNHWESGHWQLLAFVVFKIKDDKKQSCCTQKLTLNLINKLPKNITPDGRNYQKPSSKSEQWENGHLAISTIRRYILGKVV